MKSQKTVQKLPIELPRIPKTAETKEGNVFNPRLNIWPLGGLIGSYTFRFDTLEALDERIILRLKLALIWQLENNSFASSQNLFKVFRNFYEETREITPIACTEIGLGQILRFKEGLDTKTEWKLGILRILLSTMERKGYGIASAEVLSYLGSATIRGNIKGTSIRTRDPNTGAFNDTELFAIQAALNDGFARGVICLMDYALAWLLLGFGVRPIQIAALKESDLIVSEGEGGRNYALRMPRAKQRGSDVRAAFKTRYCSKQIGLLLELLIEQNSQRRAEMLLAGDEWPMFMGVEEGDLPGFRYHLSSASLARRLKATFEKVIVLKANTKRFRITMAQRAVDDGRDKYTVAELLDHSDTQNVGVYYEASPSMVLRLDRHLAMEMAPLAQAFAGVVVMSESEVLRGTHGDNRIYDRTLRDNVREPLGYCGQMSFCGLTVPFACYTCRHFQPWIDGPHEAFLEALMDDRERMIEAQYSPKIYAIKDRTIFAVAEVIQLCTAERGQADGKGL
ncbi:MAG: hypothetical protein KUA43_01810 [Hoeflea sp.]|uniref:site-specific integrase n=1 Tax=Hoeflea sp. TaxID=1940281 RepID=UPI001DFB596F|nr:site-specific integrase [Hoeflea sp.]MBU4530610.1 hypothetical protein [Alphaproteobacteria bacterium]MBU4544830.1 hypothetical protein [Alphaproteobacteria bacterium]MBU4551973.1 hypothetical protein [Alphaproteobacteria bacterium]MBV1722161.1 hypothetical protein [Hoeflea sp.]MBV1761723.1 hypothetical protein [Hoeflea sp.]